MRCLYREKIFYCGDFLEVDIYPVFTRQKSRKKKAKPTTETQINLNAKNARRKLIRLAHTNFNEESIRLDLTYNDFYLPKTDEEARSNIAKFKRECRTYCKKQGLSDLKYIEVSGRPPESRYHHHVITNTQIPLHTLQILWGKGYPTAKPLVFDEKGIQGLINYLLGEAEDGSTEKGMHKHTLNKKLWTSSRNLKKPKETERTGNLAQYQVENMAKLGNDKELYSFLYEGYTLTEAKPKFNEITAKWHISVIMRKAPPPKRQQLKRRC